MKRRWGFFKWVFLLCVGVVCFYGGVRLYFKATDGFAVSNIIRPEFENDPRWEVHALSEVEQRHVDQLLDQEFTYLGKGCQSYVFLSQDGDYVLKFFKYQRYRPKPWEDFFSFIPAVGRHRDVNLAKKRKKIERFYQCWTVAFDDLQKETGLVYLHLNKTDFFQKPLTIYDKLGWKHELFLDNMQFLIQRRADTLCNSLESHMARGDKSDAYALLDRLLDLLVLEYQRGYADRDHALMQNTGVYQGNPMHIDVGQLTVDPAVKDPEVYHQELFSKMYKFRQWLRKKYPPLADHVDEKLYGIIGESLHTRKPTNLVNNPAA